VDAFSQRYAVHSWHPHVRDEQIEAPVLRLDDAMCISAVFCFDDGAAMLLKDQLHEASDAGFVIDEQNTESRYWCCHAVL
jgi:hypothetical protein